MPGQGLGAPSEATDDAQVGPAGDTGPAGAGPPSGAFANGMLKRTHRPSGQAAANRRRRSIAPAPPKPRIINAHAPGSGTAASLTW